MSLISAAIPATGNEAASAHDSLLERIGRVCSSVASLVNGMYRFFGGTSAAEASITRENAEPADARRERCISAAEALAKLGNAFWSELVRSLCHDWLLPAWAAAIETDLGIPSSRIAARRTSTEKMDSLVSQITRHMASLDGCLRCVGLTEHATLASFAVDLRVHAAEKHSQSLLSQARELLLLDCLAEDPKDVGSTWQPVEEAQGGRDGTSGPYHDDSGPPPQPAAGLTRLLCFPPCRISPRAIKLVGLLRGALEYACACDVKSAVWLYRGARDVLDLFHAVAVQRISDDPLVPHTTLVWSNDCLLLAHCCVLFGSEFGPRLPPPLREATFADMFALLSATADEMLEHVWSGQFQESLSILQEGGSFAALGENADARDVAQRVLKKLEHQFDQLQTSWLALLPALQARERLRQLVDGILAELLSRLQDLVHISKRDSDVLAELLHNVAHKCDRVLSTSIPVSPGGRISPAPYHLRKCRQLEWILQARLKDVHERFQQGKLAKTASKPENLFSPHELLRFVHALYEHATLHSDEQALLFVGDLERAQQRATQPATAS